MSRSSRPSPRPLRLPHLKFDCCVGRAGRVPIDLGLVASIMVINSGPHPPGDARDFIHRAIRGNHVIPWCWFGHRLGVTKKHTHESAFLPQKEHLKTRKGPRILALFLQAFRLKGLVPSWQNESYLGGFLSPKYSPSWLRVLLGGLAFLSLR